MTWTKLSDDFPDRLEDLELTPTACWLHVLAMVYCNRRLNDGRFPRQQLDRLSGTIEAPDLYAAELEQAGVWMPIEGEDAWQLDWSDQEAAEVVRLRQKNQAAKQARYRRRLALHASGDHTLCSADRCPGKHQAVTGNAGPVTGDETGHVTGDVTGSRPDPSRPVPKGQGEGRCRHRKPIAADGAGCDECATEEAAAVAAPTSSAREAAS